MARINRNELPENELAALRMQFDILFAKLDNKNTQVFLDEILGHEERVMLAKRLATIILLCEGYSEYRVSRILKLSPTTTGKIANAIESGSYTGIRTMLKKNRKNCISILETVDSILHLGGALPHYNGLDRYKHIR